MEITGEVPAPVTHLNEGNTLATAFIAAQHCEFNTSTPELSHQFGIGVYAATASADFLISMEMAYYQVKSSVLSLYTSYFTNNCTQYTNSAPLTIGSMLGLYLVSCFMIAIMIT